MLFLLLREYIHGLFDDRHNVAGSTAFLSSLASSSNNESLMFRATTTPHFFSLTRSSLCMIKFAVPTQGCEDGSWVEPHVLSGVCIM